MLAGSRRVLLTIVLVLLCLTYFCSSGCFCVDWWSSISDNLSLSVTHSPSKCFCLSRAIFLSCLLMCSLWFFWPWSFRFPHYPLFSCSHFPVLSSHPYCFVHQLFSLESFIPAVTEGIIPLTWIAHVPSIFPSNVLLIISVPLIYLASLVFSSPCFNLSLHLILLPCLKHRSFWAAPHQSFLPVFSCFSLLRNFDFHIAPFAYLPPFSLLVSNLWLPQSFPFILWPHSHLSWPEPSEAQLCCLHLIGFVSLLVDIVLKLTRCLFLQLFLCHISLPYMCF